MFEPATLADLPAFCVGHAENSAAATGCTVAIAPRGATCGVAVRGGGPATRETDLLKPENMVELVHAVVLSGGSAFGLEASCGVMDALAERHIGFELGEACVPIVTGACLFDLLVGEAAHPDKAMGHAAAEAALASWDDEAGGAAAYDLPMGNVGAGCGATVGKLSLPRRAMQSGFGYACLRSGDVVVAALVAVNALGCVRDEGGRWIAGCLGDDGQVMDPYEALAEGLAAQVAQGERAADAAEDERAATAGARATSADKAAAAASSMVPDQAAKPCQNTTIGLVLTNAQLTKAQATKVSSTTHDAYARRIEPVHTSNDGDTIFTFASGEAGPQTTDTVAILATKAMERAIVEAVRHAEDAQGLRSAVSLA